ncbi:ABC transporter permease [Oceanimonas sp. NS1]|nr:ABC transporter permease [Oceanimonas sp. NS1]
MFRPLPVYLGWRFSRARRRNRFISFISVASILGIAIGVSALILGLSAMNGFQRELESRILSVLPHGQLYAADGPLAGWQGMQSSLEAAPGVKAVAPFVPLEGLLSRGSTLKAVQLQGVDPEREMRISALGPYLDGGNLDALKPGERGIIPGAGHSRQAQPAGGGYGFTAVAVARRAGLWFAPPSCLYPGGSVAPGRPARHRAGLHPHSGRPGAARAGRQDQWLSFKGR